MKNLAALLLLILIACGKEPARKSSEVKQSVSPIYSSEQLVVNVYYEEGAEPYTDKVQSVELWTILKSNLQALFEGRNTLIQVPATLEKMTKTSSHNKSSWSVQDVMNLAKSHPISPKSGVTDFQIFFLKGFADNNPGIIGFHISNTNIMAIFKDVIKSSGQGNLEIVSKYMEQATLVHEMGHALGLVNNGIPMVKSHQDSEHGAHCSNPECVMYYSNEGAASMVTFARGASLKGSVVMFDSQCLEDARKFQK